MAPILCDVVQGTTEWAMLRLGIPTASAFDRILTPAKLELSKSAEGYAHQLIAERLVGEPLDGASSGFMDRGQVLERKAVEYYELLRDADTTAIGFILRADRRVGCSPDRLVGADGLMEIKVPAPHTHVAYLLDEKGIGYRLQVQGQLWLAEREWNDTLSFHPTMPPALVRQYRDQKTITAIAAAVDRFLEFLYEEQIKLQRLYGLFPELQAPGDLRVVA